jgi:hypothetical protein
MIPPVWKEYKEIAACLTIYGEDVLGVIVIYNFYLFIYYFFKKIQH